MSLLVLLRHGQSEWNLQARFTGRTDVGLTEHGILEAKNAGALLLRQGIKFDAAHTSTQKRAYNTTEIVLDCSGQQNLIDKISRHENLCERDYGRLPGQFHAAAYDTWDEAYYKYSEAEVLQFRRSFDVRPPGGESVRDVLENRTRPYYDQRLKPLIDNEKDVLVSAHNNSLRPLMIILGVETPESIVKADLKTGVPIVYEFRSGIIVNRFTLE